MSGTNPTAAFGLSNYTTQTGTAYPLTLDANWAVAQRIMDTFAPHAQATPNMTVALDGGHVFNGASITEVAAQSSATIAAPVGNPRIDRIVVDRITGAVSVVTGTPAGSPSAPAIPSGKVPVAQVLLATSSTAITNSMISDERDFTQLGQVAGAFGPQASLASAATADLGTIGSQNVLVTGTTTITGFGSSASLNAPLFIVTFAASLTLTDNATSLILPGAQNIKTAANDRALALYLGSGNWQILDYQRANGQAVSMTGAEATLASASTTDLGAAGANMIVVTGTTTITGFGSSASTANPLYFIRFSGALTLTYNSTSLILPGAASITTAAGDFAIAEYMGSGNWRVAFYQKAASLGGGISNVALQSFTSSGTYTPTGGMKFCLPLMVGGGAGGNVSGVGGPNNGGTTSLGSLLTALGGNGSTGAGGSGGTGTGFHCPGGNGMPAWGNACPGPQGTSAGGASFFGGQGAYGAGGASLIESAVGAGAGEFAIGVFTAATIGSSQTATIGAAGSPNGTKGCILIFEFA